LFVWMKTFTAVVVAVAAVIAIVNASCDHVDVNIDNVADFVSALRNAEPGWNIILAKGKYDIDEKKFELDAQGKADCPITITCKKQGEATVVGSLNLTKSAYVTVSNIVVSSGGREMCLISEGGNTVTIDSVHVTGCPVRGISLSNVVAATIRNCVFDNMGAAVYFYQTSQSTVEYCTFGDKIGYVGVDFNRSCVSNVVTLNAFYGAGYTTAKPIWVLFEDTCDDCTKNEVSLNVFENTNERKMHNGVLCSKGAGNVFKENFMVINPQVSGVAFRVGDSQQTICASNKIYGAPLTNGKVDLSC